MDSAPQFVYEESQRNVLLETGEESVHIYSDVDREEFELIREIDRFVTATSGLLDRLLDIMQEQQQLNVQGSYFDRLNDLQQETADRYRRCSAYQQKLSDESSEVLKAQLPPLYKLEKFLKHYFRSLTVCQSLVFSQQLCVRYLQSQHHLYLYGFVRNACSTIEYLGTLIESRMGEGRLHLEDESVNAVDAYEAVKEQGLDEGFAPEQEVRIPPTNQKVKMGEIGLNTGSIRYLWDKRCDIVHDCPLVVKEEDIEHLPTEIVSTSVITADDVTKLTDHTFRLHFHSISMFIKFSTSYMMDLIDAVVETLYFEQSQA